MEWLQEIIKDIFAKMYAFDVILVERNVNKRCNVLASL